MPNILTDNSATYAAADVFSGTKTNAITRAATESDTYVTAQWAVEVDTGMQSINEFFVGDSSAGQTSTYMTAIGGLNVGENGGFAGGLGADVVGTGVAIGDASVATNDLQIQATTSSRVLFASPTDTDVGALTYNHGTDSFTFRMDATDVGTLSTGGVSWGDGTASVELTLDGGGTASLEPAVAFQISSSEVARIQTEIDGRLSLTAAGGLSLPSLTTAQRAALTQVVGHIVYDSDIESLYVSNGTTWSEIVGLTGQYFNVTEYGATGDGVTDDYTAIASAITAASSAGAGIVYFPAGTYLVSQTLRRPSAVSMLGAGVAGTIIMGDDLTAQPVVGTTVTAWVASPTVRAGFIKNLLIDNQDRANAGAIGLELAGAHDCVIEGVTVQNVETGVSLTHSSYWCELRSVRAAVVDVGFEVTNGSNENSFYSCHVVDCEVGYEVSEGANAGCSNTSFFKCAAEQFNAGSQYGYSLVTTTVNAIDTVAILYPRLERSILGGTGVNISGTCRGVDVDSPFFVNISTEIAGALDSTKVTWRGQEKRGLRVGTLDDYGTESHGLMFYNGSRIVVRNSANSIYQPLQVSSIYLNSGITISEGAGTPEGSLIAGRGSTYIDTSTGSLYTKTTTTGNTGWSLVNSQSIYREAFGFDTSTGTAEVYASFTSSVIEINTSGSPRAYSVWRAPVTGTVTAIHMIHESNATSIDFQFYQTDGSTTVGSSVTGTQSSFTLGAGTGYQTSAVMSVSVTAGDLLTLGCDGVGAIGEVNAWLEVTT